MRQEVLDYVQTLNLGTVTVSTELPWTDNDVPLYLKNLKKVYVDVETIAIEPIVTALDGLNISAETTSVRIYFANDAKVLLPNYTDIVNDLRLAKDITTVTGVQRRECAVSTAIDNDVLITELEVTFTKLLT